MNELKVGDKVTGPDGKVGKIVYYSNFVYTVEVGQNRYLYGKGELVKLEK